MTAREAVSVLRDLQPGEFYAFGPALIRTVTQLKIGGVLSTHPKVGDRLAIKTPAPSQRCVPSCRPSATCHVKRRRKH